MSDWITLGDLLENFKVTESDLINYIKEGLTPHSRYDHQPISFPIEQHEYSKKFNRLEEIRKARTALEQFIALGKEVEGAKIIYTNKYEWTALRLVNEICDALYMYSIHFGNLEPQSENGYITISGGMIQKLKKVRQKYVNERAMINAKINEIIKDDPDLNDTLESTNWKYFVKPENVEEIKKFFTELIERGAIFKREDVEEFTREREQKKIVKNNEAAIDSIIIKFGPVCEKFYEHLKYRVKKVLGETILKCPPGDLRKAAFDVFREKKNMLKPLVERNLKIDNIFNHATNRRRQIIGSLIEKAIQDQGLKLPRGYVEAYERYQKLKKE